MSRAARGNWVVQLRAGQGVSGPDCYAQCTPRRTFTQAAGALSGGYTCGVDHVSQFRKRVTIMQLARGAAASGAAVPNLQDIPFDLNLYRRTE